MKKILIVEDEAAIREFEAINLKRVGYNVEEAGSGEEALEIFDNAVENFDIALLDISMPGMDGFTLCKELRERSQTLGIIMLTAKTQEMDKISGLMMGADDYITKPFSFNILINSSTFLIFDFVKNSYSFLLSTKNSSLIYSVRISPSFRRLDISHFLPLSLIYLVRRYLYIRLFRDTPTRMRGDRPSATRTDLKTSSDLRSS